VVISRFLCARHRQLARAYGLAVHDDGAGAALTKAAAELRTVQIELIAQRV
jgi:hypothetical protein